MADWADLHKGTSLGYPDDREAPQQEGTVDSAVETLERLLRSDRDWLRDELDDNAVEVIAVLRAAEEMARTGQFSVRRRDAVRSALAALKAKLDATSCGQPAVDSGALAEALVVRINRGLGQRPPYDEGTAMTVGDARQALSSLRAYIKQLEEAQDWLANDAAEFNIRAETAEFRVKQLEGELDSLEKDFILLRTAASPSLSPMGSDGMSRCRICYGELPEHLPGCVLERFALAARTEETPSESGRESER